MQVQSTHAHCKIGAVSQHQGMAQLTSTAGALTAAGPTPGHFKATSNLLGSLTALMLSTV